MSVAAPATAPPRERTDPARIATWVIVGLLGALAVYGAVDTNGFLTMDNLRSVLSQSAYIGVFAMATALIMISGNLFSLSIGTTAAVTASCVLALLPNPAPVAIGLTLLLGLVVFGIQGALVGYLGANPIIVTIAAGGLQAGIFLWASKGATIVPPPGDTTLQFLTKLVDVPLIGELPVPVFVMFGVAIVLELVLRFTRFGSLMYLVGENRPAARAAGLRTAAVITGAFALAGVCTAIGGVELAAFNGTGSLLVESTFTYDAIAAAVVGGVLITGGRGSMFQALAGAIFVQAVSTMLLIRGYPQGWQILVKGLIVLAAVILLHLNRTRSTR
jgi:ribose/xylose/arabinose/galactoside ABC-type transport system permease subunit